MNGYVSLGRQPRIEPPFPGWPSEQIATVEEAIAEAMRRVLAEKSSQDFATVHENDITEWLENQLCLLLSEHVVPGFDSSVFEQPARGSETVNFSGGKISKKPDLTFKRASHLSCAIDTRQDAWFCECKILDGGSSHGVPKYIKDGLMRFVVGDYAWAMPSAQIIGYVRHAVGKGYVPTKQLRGQFAKVDPESGKAYVVLTALLAEKEHESHTDAVLPVYATTHAREFLLRDQRAPGPITLRHIWFQLG